MTALFAYVGPGAGFAFLGSFLALVTSLFLAGISLLTWPFRALKRAIRRGAGYRRAHVRRAIFLGLDGFDPGLAERFMAEGKLPNLKRLAEQGSYRRLRTTFPALSPVAWSTFATGVNPAKHNIFDFLDRDLKSYLPELSSSRVRPPRRMLHIGRLRIPLSRVAVEMRRRSEPFWRILGEHSIGCTILRVPITFPPEEFNGRLLSAMCTPDLRGSQGSFSHFSTRSATLLRAGDVLEGSLEGPPDNFREGSAVIAVPFRLLAGASILEIAGHHYPLKRGEYTPWIRVSFRTALGLAISGIVRFLLTETEPEASLYATPIQIDPEKPALPISHPHYYAIYLAKLLGTFATLGMAEDTWALNDAVIDDDAFLAQAELIKQEREAMFFSALEHTRRGVVACVFDTSDRVQHMFYRSIDPQTNAAHDPRHVRVIENLYRDMDRIVGRAMEHVDGDTALFVLSDHGFSSFRRGVNLNTWLLRNGYLALKGDPGKYFAGVDWSRTRAYTLGLGGLYLNIAGRESCGIVPPSQAAALREELSAKLTGLRDEATGEIAINNAYPCSALYKGPYLDAAPDLIIGYAAGYRTSWDAAVGNVSHEVFEDNTKAWSGDHSVDPVLVPGVLFTNQKVTAADPGIEDLAPTALELFGIRPPRWMEGRPLMRFS